MSAAITIAAVGTAASAYNANQANSRAGRAMDAQQASAQADLDFRREQYNRYLGLYGPTEEKLAREAMSDQPLDYDKNAAVIKTNYGNAMRNINTSMGMRGMAGSGLDVGAMRGAAMGQGAELSGAWATGLQNRRELGLKLTGRGQIERAASGVGEGMRGMTSLAGSQAGMWGNAAQAGWGNVGQGLSGIARLMQQQNQQKDKPEVPPDAQEMGGSFFGETAPNYGGGYLGGSLSNDYDYLNNGGTPVEDGGWV